MEDFLERYVHYVSFELSNVCNYSNIHKKCPLGAKRHDKNILAYSVVDNVLKFLSKNNFHGLIGYNIYNEPLIDPRLYMFLGLTRTYLGGNIKFTLWTNGFYLNQVIVDELWDMFKVDEIMVSSYFPGDEHDRLESIVVPSGMHYLVTSRTLDDRLDYYTCEENDYCQPCGAPLNEMSIKSNGDVALCCLDYDGRHIFGNLYNQSVEEIISGSEILEIHNKLKMGIREYEICKRCRWSRNY